MTRPLALGLAVVFKGCGVTILCRGEQARPEFFLRDSTGSSGEEASLKPASAAGMVSLFQGFAAACHAAPARLRDVLARADRYDLAALLLLGALTLLVAFTFRDYAISNDEEVQQRYAELIIAYYRSGLVDQALFHFRNLYLYGGLFDLVAIGLEKLIPLDPYAVRHLLSALTGVGGIAAVWATARAIGGPRAGLLAAAAIALCGTWYGAMFNHTKDIPFAAAMMGATYLLVRIGRQLPHPRWRLVALFGVLCGCALGIRVLGLFLLAYALFVVAVYAPTGRRASWRAVPAFTARSAVPLTAAFLLAYVIMIATWPWATLAPLNPLRAIFEFTDFHYKIQTILDGRVYYMSDVPRSYVPTYVAIKLTLVLLIGAALSLVLVVLPQRAVQAGNARQPANNTWWRRETAFIAFAAFFPLICDVIMRGPAFSGMRHFLFTVPPIAVLAGLGIDGMLSRLWASGRAAAAFGLALVLLDLGWNATTLYRLHPDEYLFFNPLVGGLAGAARRYDTDYWVNIMPEAVGDLEHFLDRTEGPSGKSGQRRHYLVAVCGEQLPFEKEADARLAWTRDLRHAEFFIAPTHMNCDRALDGKVVASIERMGVVIGVVKDRRALIRSVAGLN
jgi:Dolichyl-phosphate-mannose-protein mannosyltransferase